MARNRNKNRVFRFNRRIEGRTDYQLRLKLLRSNLPRIVVRRSNKNMLVQFVTYDSRGDKILTSAHSRELTGLGFNLNTGNLVSAYLTGLLAGKKALKAGINGDCIVDLGLARSYSGSRIYAAVKGVLDSGVSVRVSETIFPPEQRLDGSHLKGKDAQKIVEKTKKAIEGMK